MSSLGAYIQHRWYNPSAPRQTAEDVMPYAARMYGLGSVMGSSCSSVPLPDGSSISPLGDGTRVMPGQAVDVWILGVSGRRGVPVIGAAYTERDVPVYRVYVKNRATSVRELRWLVAARAGRGLRVRWTSLCALPAKPGTVRAMYDIDEDGNAAGASATLRGVGSIFGSTVGEASEWIDFVKIGVWIVGGLTVGYLAGFLYRELRTANRPRRRNRRRRNTGGEMDDLFARAASVLGWSYRDVRTFSPRMVAEMVRTKDPALREEILALVESGRHILEKPARRRRRW